MISFNLPEVDVSRMMIVALLSYINTDETYIIFK